MVIRLILLFTIIPAMELIVLIWLAQETSLLFTIVVILITGVGGAILAKLQGLWTLQRMMNDVRLGRLPTNFLAEGILVLLAGALLLTPGLITDAAGLLVLIPGIRRAVGRYIIRRIKARLFVRTNHFSSDGDGEFREGRDRIVDVRIVNTHKRAED